MSAQVRRGVLWLLYLGLLTGTMSSCTSTNCARTPATANGANIQPEKAAVNTIPVIHVFVALADNVNPGIVPVEASLGNGDNAATKLYWGAPEAYVLSAAIDGWMKKESDEQIRVRAADAYNKYQNCGVKAARALFATGW